MIAVDTQILVYAHRGESAFHAKAVSSLRELAESGHAWAIPWPCAHEFLGIVTRPRLWNPPSTIRQALTALDRWRVSPGLRFIHEGVDHYQQLTRLLVSSDVTGARVHDARVAALCLSHGVRQLWTMDRDFSRFPAVKTRNPLL
jgi:hypothetical protein